MELSTGIAAHHAHRWLGTIGGTAKVSFVGRFMKAVAER